MSTEIKKTELMNRIEKFILGVEGKITTEISTIPGAYKGLKFQKKADAIQERIYAENIDALILLIAEASEARDAVAVKKGKNRLRIWANVCDLEVETVEDDSTPEPVLVSSSAKQVQQLPADENINKPKIAPQADEINRVKVALKKAYEFAERFLINNNRAELEKGMYPMIKLAKEILNKVHVNPRDVMADEVHGFLNRAEEYADDGNEDMMKRVFFLCRGLAGTIGIKDQIEKRIRGIQVRAAKAIQNKKQVAVASSVA